MPKTAMHEHRESQSRYYDVRTAGKITPMQSKAKARRMKNASYEEFRASIA